MALIIPPDDAALLAALSRNLSALPFVESDLASRALLVK
jgi:hypothetical protein